MQAMFKISYFSVFFAEVFAPYDLNDRNSKYIFAPPQALHLIHEGEFIGPFVYGYKFKLNMDTLEREYSDDPKRVMPLRFFL